MKQLESKGDLFKIRDTHADHEAILYINNNNFITKVMFKPPAPLKEESIIKGITVYEEVPPEEEELFEGAQKIFNLTKNIDNLPIHFQLQRLILLNMDGKKTLADIFQGLAPDWPDLSPQFIENLVRQCEIRGWIREKKSLKDHNE